jgi:broad specificity phosphatase PhoE
MTVGSQVILVRHGETEWSLTGKHTGRTDIPLTELGRRQADELAGMLQGRSFAQVMSSPLQRALETCERTGLRAHAELNDDLLEWDYGIYEGISTAETRQDIPGWSVWTHPITGGESVEQVGERADRIIQELLAVSGDSVVFGHGQFSRILAARWIGLPATAGQLLAFDTAAISILGFERETRVIQHWNERCHLRNLDEDS